MKPLQLYKLKNIKYLDQKYFILNIKILGYSSLIITLLLASGFTLWQMFEYYDSLFYISDSIYGSNLFMTIEFHSFHILIGTMFWVLLYIEC